MGSRLADAGLVGEASHPAVVPEVGEANTGEQGVAGVAAGQRWRALLASLVGIAVMFGNIYATQPILPALSRDFAVPPAASALTVSVVVLGMGIASLIYGPLSDRAGRRPVIAVTACLLVLPTLGATLAPSFSVLLICRALQGLLIPGITAVGLAYLQEVLPPSWRGVSTSAYVSATALGGLIGRMQGGFLTDAYGWRAAFGSFVVTTSLSALLLVVWLPAVRRVAALSPEQQGAGGWLRELGLTYARLGSFVRQPRVLGGAIIGFTMFFGFVSIFTYLPYRMQSPPFSLSQSQISLLYLVYLVGFFVTPWTGRLSDRFGRPFVIGASLVLMISGSIFTSLDTPIGPEVSVPAIGLAISPAFNGTLVGLVLLNIGLLAAHAAASAFVNHKAFQWGQAASGCASGWAAARPATHQARATCGC
jgi:MFS transporter, YNFM family, putative membrane transport protein